MEDWTINQMTPFETNVVNIYDVYFENMCYYLAMRQINVCKRGCMVQPLSK